MEVVLFSKNTVYSIASADDSSTIGVKEALPADVQAAACSGAGVYYLACCSSPTVLSRWKGATSSVEEVATFPSAISQIVFHRNKVFCGTENSHFLYSYDPLCLKVEVLDVGFDVVNFEPAEHGFVFQSGNDVIYGYHFNDGTTLVDGSGTGSTILGHYKRVAVAFVPERGGIVGITEHGNVVKTDLQLPKKDRFIALGEKVVCYDAFNALVVLPDGREIPLPIRLNGLLLLGSVPITDEETLCTLCLCEFDGGDGVTLDCGHCFHHECVEQWERRWQDFKDKGNHVVFTHAVCPGGCKYLLRHPHIMSSKQINALYRAIQKESSSVLANMGVETKTEDDLLFYLCGRCSRPFFGGERVCSRMQGSEPINSPESLLCQSCRDDLPCTQHAIEFVCYKCIYCCNPATQRSFSTRYMCDRCNARWLQAEPTTIPCPGPDQCPLNGVHPSEGEVVIGCLLCMAEGSIVVDRIQQPDTTALPS